MKYRIKEFQWAETPAFIAEQSEDGTAWEEIPLFPICRSLATAKNTLAKFFTPPPEPIYHDYP